MSWYSDGEKPSLWYLYSTGDAYNNDDYPYYEYDEYYEDEDEDEDEDE